MMGRQSRQTAMIFVDIESLIPETHLLRKIERMVSFDFIYDLLAPYYPATGRPSVDPVSMFKMLLIGYLYGIKSERRLVEEVQLNIAYRWFCGFELDDTIPNHSTFSKTRTRKWQQSDLFQKAFYEIVKQCMAIHRSRKEKRNTMLGERIALYMAVDEILSLMTEEEAAELVVTTGVNKGWTMAQVSEQRPSSLKYYAYLCEDCGNIMKAAAMLLMGGSQQLKAS